MKSFNNYELLSKVSNDVAKATETKIMEQLNWLVSRGLIVIEQGPMSFVQAQDSNTIEIRHEVSLVLKDKEYIEGLEAKNSDLEKQLEYTSNLLSQMNEIVNKRGMK